MDLDKLKFADIQKLQTANDAAKKANKEALGKLKAAKGVADAAEEAIEAEAEELGNTED